MLKQIGFVYEKQAEQCDGSVAGFGTWADLGVRSNCHGAKYKQNEDAVQRDESCI